MRRASLVAILVLGLGLPAAGRAWHPDTCRKIVGDALKLACPDLKLMMRRYRSEFLEGFQQGGIPTADADSRVRQIRRDARQVVNGIRRGRGFAGAIRTMGRIARQVAELNHPILCNGQFRSRAVVLPDYDGYIERSIPLFRIVLRNDQDRLVDFDDLDGFLERAARRARHLSSLLEAAYFEGGVLHSSDSFDPHSVPFGIASIAYSSAVNDTVNIWLFLWRAAGGSNRGAPLIELTTGGAPEPEAPDSAQAAPLEETARSAGEAEVD